MREILLAVIVAIGLNGCFCSAKAIMLRTKVG